MTTRQWPKTIGGLAYHESLTDNPEFSAVYTTPGAEHTSDPECNWHSDPRWCMNGDWDNDQPVKLMWIYRQGTEWIVEDDRNYETTNNFHAAVRMAKRFMKGGN